MQWPRNLSIKRKLTLVIALTSTMALLLAAVAAVGYEFAHFRHERVLDLTAQAEIISANSATALSHRDPNAASQILSALQTQHEVVSGRIFDRAGRLFAEYVRPDATALPISPPTQTEGYRFEGSHVLFYHAIILDGRTIGTLVLRSDLRELKGRFIVGTSILVVAMLASLLVALLVAARLQRIISDPVLNLARVAREVAGKKDYSLRVAGQSNDEIGLLMKCFNEMVAQIQARDNDLQASELRFRQLAETIREVFWISDLPKKQIIYVSPGYEEIWGRSCASLYANAQDWRAAIHAEDRERVLHAAVTRQVSGQYDEEYRIVRPDGSIRWIRDRAFPVRDEAGQVYRIVGIAEDITGRKELERRLLEVTDREQARVGQDLHDGLCQQLVGAAFVATLLKEDLATQSQNEAQRAAKIATLLNDAINQARNLARGLYPIKLETEGLLAALLELATNVTNQSKIACEVECPQPVSITDRAAATHLYRIAQEAVNNAVRHACARRIVIHLGHEDGDACLSVSDDGIGPPAETAASRGMGIRIMNYRSSMIGGALAIGPGARGGTIVSCIFDLKSLKES